jgi:hypothetical protein
VAKTFGFLQEMVCKTPEGIQTFVARMHAVAAALRASRLTFDVSGSDMLTKKGALTSMSESKWRYKTFDPCRFCLVALISCPSFPLSFPPFP